MPRPIMKRFWNQASSNFSKNVAFAWSKPALNIKEYDDKYEIDVMIGQIDPAQVKIEVKENILYISYKDQNTDQDQNTDFEYVYQEFGTSSFERSYELPDDADQSQIKAAYSKGVLTITIAKKPQEPTKSIKIEIGE